MSNIISFPSARLQQHSSPDLGTARDLMMEVFTTLEEIRMAVASLSKNENAPRIELTSHVELSLGAAEEPPAEASTKLSSEGA
ncbi:hypothetical protein [Rhizobium sp. SL42]|uniref:hypothetical protein n=1 Tax=Rhizobium sp. SL42 TaxID=2806346 RepID=UPI001F47D45E|nr:hypothetical protein [Rhizobium sp. SL42]UJW77593.1 hypothetical protein IM739_23550 [Rhizobium sp. SL42]